jgi:hypothetical protein
MNKCDFVDMTDFDDCRSFSAPLQAKRALFQLSRRLLACYFELAGKALLRGFRLASLF